MNKLISSMKNLRIYSFFLFCFYMLYCIIVNNKFLFLVFKTINRLGPYTQYLRSIFAIASQYSLRIMQPALFPLSNMSSVLTATDLSLTVTTNDKQRVLEIG